jgi:hypothetical protein
VSSKLKQHLWDIGVILTVMAILAAVAVVFLTDNQVNSINPDTALWSLTAAIGLGFIGIVLAVKFRPTTND